MTTARQLREQRKNTLIAIALTCVAYALFNIGDAALKMLAQRHFQFPQIVLLNCTVIIICMAISGWWKEGKKAFRMKKPGWIYLRAVFSSVVGILNILGLPHIKLTTFYTLVFTSPFWVAVLAAIVMKEKLDKNRMAVILAGFAVILFVFRPGGGLFDIYALLILIGAFFYSCGLVVLRKLGPHESRTMLIIVGSVVSMAVSVALVAAGHVVNWFTPMPDLIFHWVTPTPYEWGLFFLMGFLGAISVTCIAYAFQNAPSASVVAPYHYTQIVWGALLGYYLFGEVPDDRTILGAGLIIAAGLYLIFSETRRKPKVTPIPESGEPL